MRLPGRQSLARAWDAQSAARRAAWIALAIFAAAIVTVALIAAPLSEAIARARADAARQRLVLDIAKARVAENATLARASAPIRTPDMRGAIERVLAREGLAFAPEAAQGADRSVRIVIAEARFDALVRALDALAREDGVRIAEATITARVDPGSVRAELALTR
jgi:type II secretory pathway component PulM